MKAIISFFFDLIICSTCFAQTPGISAFQNTATKLNLKLKTPKNFDTVYFSESYLLKKNYNINASNFQLVSRKKDLIIYIVVMPYDTTGSGFINKHFKPKFNLNENYRRKIELQADTLTTKVNYYRGNELKKHQLM